MKNIISTPHQKIGALTFILILLGFSNFSIAQGGPPPGVGGPPLGVGQNPIIIQDSVIVMNRLYANEKLIVEQQGRFKQDLVVDGSARIYSDLRVDHDVRFDGESRLNGNVHIMNLSSPTSIDPSIQILVVMPDGQVKKITGSDLNKTQEPNLDCIGPITNPQWFSGLNKLYVPCPQVRVGIGNSNPGFSLTVEGISYAHKLVAGSAFGPTNAVINGFSQGGLQDLLQVGVNTGQVRFKITNSGTVMMYNNGGHSLIAYDDAGDKILQLENSGVLRSREVRVNEDAWPDYVFDKNYKLPKLTDVAKFIKKNNHLPGVPTAQEIKNDGLNLGDMQTIQMQKIEELTLYLIEMDEKINAMEKRMGELEKENVELKKNTK